MTGFIWNSQSQKGKFVCLLYEITGSQSIISVQLNASIHCNCQWSFDLIKPRQPAASVKLGQINWLGLEFRNVASPEHRLNVIRVELKLHEELKFPSIWTENSALYYLLSVQITCARLISVHMDGSRLNMEFKTMASGSAFGIRYDEAIHGNPCAIRYITMALECIPCCSIVFQG